MTTGLRVLVAGCGSIGRRHIRNLLTLGVNNFILCDPNKESLAKASEALTNPVLCESLQEALTHNPGAAVICTPSSMHLEMAMELAKRNVHIFVEKPLSHTVEGCEALDKIVELKGIVGMMGMCYRFHPVFQHVKTLLASVVLGKVYHVNYYGGHYLPDWHPYADYRTEYAAKNSLGGGVVLTSIHGLDNIRWLFGEVAECKAFVDRVSSLEMDVEDLAIGIFRMKSGAYVNWQTDFLQRVNQHRMIIAGEKGTIRCDFVEGTIETYLTDFGKWFNGRLVYEVNAMYVEEMKHFLECVEKKTNPSVDIKDGYRTLKLALEVKSSMRKVRGQENICLTA
ncbi:MAG: Gfo/Idh/MocA family oxidoreductase [Deltaproteobacteria bacterium]|nr:Gfo/Idh/MocA family oxidoreductase [Deltaproteobacteria bacterium]